MEKFDITTQKIYVYDRGNLFVDNDSVFAVYEYDFNPDEYFKTEINQPDENAYLCFMTGWNMKTGEISLYYWGDFEGGEKENEKELTKKEQAFFKKVMERCCLELYGCSIRKLWERENKDNYEDE